MATKEKANPQLTDSEISAQKAVISGSINDESTREGALQVKLVAGGRNRRNLPMLKCVV